jgi:NitT/TauT family transport system substrate-binding protein
VISFSVATLNSKPNTVRKFLAAVHKAITDVNADPAKWNSLLTDKTLVPAPLVGQYKLPHFPAASVPTEAQFNDVEAWMKDKGLLTTDVAYDKLVDASYLPK